METLQNGQTAGFIELPILPSAPRVTEEPLLLRILAEQQQLSAAEEFSRQHCRSGSPAQAKYYSKLIPATPPGPGQQYAFEVDLDRCSGCKACVVACHSMNGLDDRETWRDVGLLVGGTRNHPVMQHVTTACHHCLEPACMTACPVDAYEKDPVTGIVKHLDDQCFGCQYCTLACPYDVPKYHKGKGIVRKCDMCSDRLAEGEAPACVQACPHEAIAIRIVEVSSVRENSEADPFLPAAPEPYLTFPTTTFKTNRVFPRNMLPADYYSVNPQHPHWPLILMLVLTQLSVGAFTVELVLESFLDQAVLSAFRPVQSLLALGLGLLALGASTLHLGRPQYAFRAVIGLKHSWLSREILVFGLFAGNAFLYSLAQWTTMLPAAVTQLLGWMVVLTGVTGVACSAMIYAVTKREFWELGATTAKFGLTGANLGLATGWLAMLLVDQSGRLGHSQLLAEPQLLLGKSLAAGSVFKLLFESSYLLRLQEHYTSPLKRSAMLMAGALWNVTLARFACGLLGGVVLPLIALAELKESSVTRTSGLGLILFAFLILLTGEFLERYLFFAAVSSPRMPGGPRR